MAEALADAEGWLQRLRGGHFDALNYYSLPSAR